MRVFLPTADTRGSQRPALRALMTERDLADAGAGLAPLGFAEAGHTWRWASDILAPEPLRPVQTVQTIHAVQPRGRGLAASVLRVPPSLLRAMASAAREVGVSESAVWAAAARAWLDLRAREDEPQPQPPTPAAPARPVPPPARSWAGIDALLDELRRPAAA